jgi:cell division protein FtsX
VWEADVVGCLAALFALALPRLTIFILWVFTDRLTIAFNSFVVGFLGFLILPYTTVFYALAYAPVVGVRGFGWLLVGMGFLMDLSSYFNSDRERRRRV